MPPVRWWLLAVLAVAAIACVLVFRASTGTVGLGDLPPLPPVAGIADGELLSRVQGELSRRAAGDWRHLPPELRAVWMVEAVEDGLRRDGLRPMVLADRDGAPTTHRPRLDELAVGYRDLGLADAAAAIDDAVRRGDAPPAEYAAIDARFRTATATSAQVRRAWIRAHADAVAR